MAAAGESWPDDAKIQHLRNLFLNSIKMSTVSMAHKTVYYKFTKEIQHIMLNFEETEQYKTANKKWREKNLSSVTTTIEALCSSQGLLVLVKLDSNSDTVMTST